ncbi:unnamed protein product, partial [Allacma fusca]
MCPELLQKEKTTKPETHDSTKISHANLSVSTTTPETSKVAEHCLANVSGSPEILLKTLMAQIKLQGKTRRVRVVIDDGSVRSYILKSLAEELNLEPLGQEPLVHALFGGINSGRINHQRYEVPLTDVNGNVTCNLTLLDQSTICTAISKVPLGSWLDILQEKKIRLSDVGTGSSGVDILLGSDVASTLMTGKTCRLNPGLLAIEYTLGWTLMGTVPRNHTHNSTTTMVSLLNTESLQNLWQLEVIGIRDPSEVSSRL